MSPVKRVDCVTIYNCFGCDTHGVHSEAAGICPKPRGSRGGHLRHSASPLGHGGTQSSHAPRQGVGRTSRRARLSRSRASGQKQRRSFTTAPPSAVLPQDERRLPNASETLGGHQIPLKRRWGASRSDVASG
ncbi:hypothetical protein NDU88_001478 [Pleurodeles waltl]|uniref:Uncharacterized protein n=1 Tax=Pleurodeles waltl TaxID=8319 RepID=A0AAV7M8B4_PLEWA|nr:hypothetical protein NDU88_001478 [Pleurodeles waltl]